MKKRIGIIGFGEMGKRHGLEFWESSKGEISIAGVVDPDDDMYANGCDWNNRKDIPRYSSVDELLDKENPDGILIVSPNFTHYENLKKLRGRTLPVLLEKPLDTSLEKISDIVRFAREYKGPVIVDHVMRYAPVIQKGRELVEAGKLGRLCTFNFTQRTGIGMYHTFRRTIEKGGSHIIVKATHDLDCLIYITASKPLAASMISARHVVGGDKPNDLTCDHCPEIMECKYAHVGRKLQGNARIKDVSILNRLCVFAKEIDVPDDEVCTIKLSGGIFGTYSHSYFCDMPGHSRLYEIIGTDGALYITLAKENSYEGEVKYYPFNDRNTIETFTFGYSSKIHYYGGPFVVKHFYDLMCGRETRPFSSVESAYTAEILGMAAMKSSRENNRFVDLMEIVPEDLRDAIVGG